MMNLFMTYKRKKESIMKDFDFKRVHDIFQHMNYEYSDGNRKFSIPSVERLKDTVESLLDMAFNNLVDLLANRSDIKSPIFVSSGRFTIEIHYKSLELENITVSFVPIDIEV